MVFCNLSKKYLDENIKDVTILILIDGFLQFTTYGGFYMANEESQSLF